MIRVKRSVWMLVFKSAVSRAKQLVKNPDEVRQLIEEALRKIQKHSTAIREILEDLQKILRLVKAWIAGDYKDISLQSIVILIAAILYFLNPFDTIPDPIPIVGYVDDASVVAWVLAIAKIEIDKFRVWESASAKL